MSGIDDQDESEDSTSDSTPATPAIANAPTTQAPLNPTVAAYLQNIAQNKQDMSDAQQKANTNLLISGLGRAGSTLAQSGYGNANPIDTSAYNDFDKAAEAPVQQVLAKQKSQKAAIDDAADESKTAATIAANDPASPASKAVQAQIGRLYPGKYSPEQLANVSASMAPTILKPLELDEKIQQSAQIKQDQRDQKASDKQKQDFNSATVLAESMRGSPAVAQAEKDIYASQKVNTLFSKYGDLNNLSPQMANLATAEVAKIASNASPDDHMMQMLSPNAFRGTLASAWQKVTNEPSPANAGAFLQQYKDYADGITQDAHKVITDRYGRLYNTRKDQWSSQQQQSFKDSYLNRFDDAADEVGTPSQSGNQSQSQGTVARKTKDGRTAIFDANSKQFLRYQ